MIARAPILQVFWLAIVLSPFAIPLLVYKTDHPLLATILLVPAMLGADYLEKALIRHTRRRVLQSRIRAMSREEKKPIVLISRSYSQVRELHTNVPIPLAGILENKISLISALINDLSYKHPLVVLGDKDLGPDEPANRALYMSAWPDDPDRKHVAVVDIENRRVTSSRIVRWEDIFLLLAGSAQFVLVIPGASEGVFTELALLRAENLWSKVVIYMWPERGGNPTTTFCADATAWETLRSLFRKWGIELPPHRAEGALLRVDDQFEIQAAGEPIPARNILMPLAGENRDAPALRKIASMIEEYEIVANPDRYLGMWGHTIQQ